MNPIDKRTGELIVRLRLSRRAAELRAYLEAINHPAHNNKPNPPDTNPRRSHYHLAA